MTARWRILTAQMLAGAAFAAFIAYYGLLCFRPEWGGDLQMYCAGIARLYRDFSSPTHEAVAVPGNQSTVYTAYLVGVAILGEVLGLTPFRALQVAGVGNLLLFVASLCFFCSRLSLHRRWELPAACLLVCMLLVHWLHIGWSSAISLTNLQYIQPYPSTFGWSLALFTFGLAQQLRMDGRIRTFAALILVLALLLLPGRSMSKSWRDSLELWPKLTSFWRAEQSNTHSTLGVTSAARGWDHAPHWAPR